MSDSKFKLLDRELTAIQNDPYPPSRNQRIADVQPVLLLAILGELEIIRTCLQNQPSARP